MPFYFRNLAQKSLSQQFFKTVLKEVLLFFPEIKLWEIGLILVTGSKIKSLNKKYRGQEWVTDVLSFDLGQKRGEIFLAPAEAEKQAREMGHSDKQELATLFIHGLLHILGYQDQSKKFKEKMFKMQERILEHLSRKNFV